MTSSRVLVLFGCLVASISLHSYGDDAPVAESVTRDPAAASGGARCVEYQVIEGTEELYGLPDAQRGKAMSSWRTGCDEWRKSVREMNKGNQVLAAGCGKPQSDKEGELWVYRSTGTYRVKTRMKEEEK